VQELVKNDLILHNKDLVNEPWTKMSK